MNYFIALLVIYMGVFTVSFFLYGKTMNNKADKKSILHIFYPMSELMLKIIGRLRKDKDRRETTRIYRNLFIGQNAKLMQKERQMKNTAIAMIILLISLIFSILLSVSSYNEGHLSNGEIYRPGFGENDFLVDLEWYTNASMEEIPEEGKLTISIEPQRLKSEEKIRELFKMGENYIDSHIFNEGDNNQSVTSDLILMKRIPELGIEIEWSIPDTDWIYSDGRLRDKVIPTEGVLVDITAKMSYYDEINSYQFKIHIIPKEITPMERFETELTAYIKDALEDNSDDVIELPNQIAGEEVRWEEKIQNRGMIIFALGIIVVILLYIRDKNEIESMVRERDKELAMGYSNMIAKFLLLIGAGSTIKGAFDKITSDFEKNGEVKGYLYKEMKVTRNELYLGVSEMKAYESFGKRCGQIAYLRFGTILVQNLSHGAKGTLPMLELEAKEAFEERKELAKRQGEEASTKMLFPMMGMLGIVLVIVMVPALWTF